MEFTLDGSLSFWIKKIYQKTGQLFNERLAQFGLTTAQVEVLALLWNYGDGQTQKELHEKLCIRPASLTKVLDMLVAGGWVERKQDAEDARVNRIYLTEKGMAQEKVCAEILFAVERLIRKNLSPEEAAILLMLLKKAESSLEEEKE
jgi:DNA-binding MarR family transcriptional regulator